MNEETQAIRELMAAVRVLDPVERLAAVEAWCAKWVVYLCEAVTPERPADNALGAMAAEYATKATAEGVEFRSVALLRSTPEPTMDELLGAEMLAASREGRPPRPVERPKP